MSTQFPSTDTVKISNIELINIPGPSRHGTYWIEISYNGEVTKRSQKKRADGDHIVWPESLSFTIADLTDQSFWHFKIVNTRLSIKEKTAMSHKKKLVDLLQSQEDFGSCKLTISKDYQLIFTIERQGDALPGLVNETKNELARTSTSEHSAKFAEHVMKANEVFVAQEDLWMSFLPNFKIFMSAVDNIAEIHPYVQFAWGILSVIPKTIISQNERDDSINELSQHLKKVYEYITDAKRLPTFKEAQRKALSTLVQQTIECAYFLKEYAVSNKGIKVLKAVTIDKKVVEFNKKLDHILDVMTNSTALETNIVTLRISNDIGELKEKAEELKDLNLLEGLSRAQNAGFLSTKACLPGTRQGLITEILDWVNVSGDGSQRLFLLLGQAGMGKTAVAHTISHLFDKQNRLGSVFCFNKSYKENRNVLFSTITRELADGDVEWRKSLVRIIEKTSVRTSLDILTQFDELIIKPSEAVNTIGPVVIVIDGLDESGDPGERALLLNLLFERSSEFPSNYRFVITSRPEPDIEPWSKHPTVFCKRMADIDLVETTDDIQEYIYFRLFSVKDILDRELDHGWRFLLAKRAEGVFQWAKLACDVINRTGYGVARRANTFISGPTSSLFQMYHEIFLSRPEFEEEGYLPAFKTIMGALIIARKPLSIQALQSLFQNDFPHDIKTIMDPFHSLFLGTHDLCTPVQPLHTSLTDFLISPSIEIVDGAKEKKNIPNQFYVDTSDQSSLTLACLKLMNSGEGGLRFNICDLENSHLRNKDVPDLDNRVQKKIPPHLSYASYFWAIHLQQSNISEDLLIQLRLLMGTNLLYLFETVSLSEKSVEQVCISMRILAYWCKDVDSELASQADDACQFGYNFGDAMVESTPHLYLSALPFAPNGSFIRDHYLHSFPHHFNIELGQSLAYRSSDIIKRHPNHSALTAVAFSPQGRYIATGYEDGGFWLWDYKTGAIIYQCRIVERNPGIRAIAFSPNGESVTFCLLNGSFKILNIPKNELIDHSFYGVPGYNWGVSISIDGRYIVFNSHTEGISLYNVVSRSTIRVGSWSSQSIISPNGELLASFVDNFDDKHWKTISLWSIQKQESIGSFRLDGAIKHMSFSPDGNQMALLYSHSIQIWDVLTAAKPRKFTFSRKIGEVGRTVIFSSDGQNVLFVTDRGIQIMDISTGVLVWSIPSKNDLTITHLAVSSDCKHVAWSIRRDTIQVQECESTPRRSEPIYHRILYTEAIFSPSNTYLVLEGYDPVHGHKYLQILNTATMIIIAQPETPSFAIFAISPNDEYIAYFATYGLCLWSNKGGELVLDPSDRKFTALAFSFTGDRLISGDQSGTVMIWNTHTCQLVCSPYKSIPPKTPIIAITFSRTGMQFLVGYKPLGSNKMIKIYSSQSGKLLRGPFIIPGSERDDLNQIYFSGEDGYTGECTLAFSANETHIVYSHTWIKFNIIDAGTGQILKTFTKYHGIKDMKHATSPNRKYIVKRPFAGKAEVWDIETGKAINGKWDDHSAKLVAFSNSSEEFATLDEGEINFWDISSRDKSARPTFYHDNSGRLSTKMSMNDKYLVLIRDGILNVWCLETHQNMSHYRSIGRKPLIDHSGVKPFDRVIHDQSSSRPDGRERTEYALVAWNKALFSESSRILDGWVLGPSGELLFWIPPEQREGLWRPNMVHLMGVPITKLGFDNFVHGPRWTECKEKL